MGASTERFRSYLSQQAAGAQTQAALQGRQEQERVLRQQEMLLGTEQQLEGELTDLTEAEIPFLGRFQLDRGALSSFLTHEKSGGLKKVLLKNEAQANAFMDQAQQAAKEGNLELAQELRTKAENVLTDPRGRAGGLYPILDAQDVRAAFTYNERPESEGMLRLQSPQAQTLGEMVADARAFQDYGSERSRAFRKTLTEGAQRSIAAQARQAQRTARDFGLARGSARSPYAAAQVSASMERDFAAQRAQVETSAAQYFEQYRREFARDTLGFAQAWLAGQAGIRESFQSAVDNIRLTSAGHQMQGAALSQAFSADSRQAAAASKQRTMGAIGAGLNLLGGILSLTPGTIGGGLASTVAGVIT